jgi:hypothetical protein
MQVEEEAEEVGPMADSKMPMNCPGPDKAVMASSGKRSGASSGGNPIKKGPKK